MLNVHFLHQLMSQYSFVAQTKHEWPPMVVRRALDVLDLLLTFQFNTRLESFIAKFKTAEISASAKTSKLRTSTNILMPLLYDDFDPFDTSK